MDEKKWVFDELVEEKNDTTGALDITGLIAYSLYKKTKSEVANKYRKDGASEDFIKQKIYEFHQNVLSSELMLAQYRAQAGAIIYEMESTLEDEILKEYEKQYRIEVEEEVTRAYKEEHEGEIHTIKDNHEKKIIQLENKIATMEKNHETTIEFEKKKAVTEFIKKVKKNHTDGRGVRFIKWLLNGFSGLIAAVISTLVFGGFIYYKLPDEKKDEGISSIILEVTKLLVGS